MLATGLAGALGVASNKIATLCGDKGKVVMTSIFIFVIGKYNLINFLILHEFISYIHQPYKY
jgi:hypothetical protein